jgi:uncharacterized membrane protein YdjX (TVP38/TMEM64 family)
MMDEQTTNSSYQHSTSIEEQSSYRRYSTAETIPHSNSNDSQIETASPSKRKCPWGKIIIATILIGIVTFVIIDSLTNQHISTGFQEFLTWIESNLVAGVFAFMGVYFIATVCFVPGSLLTLGSGFVFGSAVGVGYGVVLASLAVFVGAALGSIAAFLLGRYLMRDCVRNKLVKKYPVIEAVDEALQNNGLKIFFLLRLSPIVPFNAINYIAGVTGISVKDYCFALIVYCRVRSCIALLVQVRVVSLKLNKELVNRLQSLRLLSASFWHSLPFSLLAITPRRSLTRL